MAEFLSKLEVEKVTEAKGMFDRATWLLMEPLIYRSDVLTVTLIVPAGFVTDFASVPRVGGLYDLVGDTGHASATVHDWLCRSGKVPRSRADKVFREALEVEEVPAWRRNLMYLGVRIGSFF